MRKLLTFIGFVVFFCLSADGQNYNHSTGTISGCSGNYYDGGGSTKTYSKNESDVFTICGDTDSCVVVVFDTFAVEDGVDFLYVYGGATEDFPLIGVYTGTTIPDTFISTEGCLTFKFISDNFTQDIGWEAHFYCTACPPNGCLPFITNCVDSLCAGSFFDTGGPAGDYSGNEDSIHTICGVDSTQCISAKFHTWSVSNGDTLHVFDGPDTNGVYMGGYSASNPPTAFYPQSGCITFRWISNGSNHNQGWIASLKCIPCPTGNCLPDMGNCKDTLCTSPFYDPGGINGNYPDGFYFVHTVCPDDTDKCMFVTFDTVALEGGNNDMLNIYEGEDLNGQLLWAVAGNQTPPTVGSKVGCMTFELVVNDTINEIGWESNLSCKPCPCLPDMGNCYDEVCNGNFYDPGGSNGAYNNDTSLIHTICNYQLKCTEVDFTIFSLGAGDSLGIFNGADTSAALIGWYTGTDGPGTVTSSSTCLTFWFVADSTDNGSGWKADISCVNCPSGANCLPVIGDCNDTVCTGKFYDTGGANLPYQDDQELLHTICSDDSSCVGVDFTSFNIESGFDFLHVFDGPDTLGKKIGKFTGVGGPGVVTSSTGCLTFFFESDLLVVASGWEANIFCVPCPVICVPIMQTCTDSTCLDSLFDSGGMAADYGNNEFLVHTLCSDELNCISLNFSSFDLGAGDSLWVYDGPDTTYPFIGAYGGTNSPGVALSTTGCLTLVFKSDSTGTDAGWVAEIQCGTCPGGICGPDMDDGCLDSTCTGNFYDEGGPNGSYVKSTDDFHTICSDSGNCVRVDFNFFQTEPFVDKLYIFEGIDSSGKLLGVYSGNNSPGFISSNTGCLTFWFVSDDNLNYAGWEALITCGKCPPPCQPTVAGFTDTTSLLTAWFTDTSHVNSNVNYIWDFGDGTTSLLQNPIHQYSTEGSYQVCLFVEDSCALDTMCDTVTLACPPPTVAFGDSIHLSTVFVTDSSTGQWIDLWIWDWGDGTTDTAQNTQHTYSANGDYEICLTVYDTCGPNTACDTVTIFCPPPTAAFTDTSTFFSVSFTNNSTGNFIDGYLWDFGDGFTSTGSDPVHIYATTGSYTVCLVVYDTCSTDTTCQTVVVTCPKPSAGFSHSSTFYNATFTDASAGNFVSSWTWDFGDASPTSNQQNPSHTYSANGTYTVCLIISDTCESDTNCQSVTINCPPPSANFSSSTSFLNATFSDASSGNFIDSWLWDFGDGNTSTQQSPTHVYAGGGSYTVCLTVTDTCNSDSICKTVIVNCPLPSANFTSTVNMLTVSFSNTTSGNFIAGYIWDFGDGNFSTSANPTHTYTTGGSFTVCLSTSDTCGTDSTCKTVTPICPDPIAGFTDSTSLLGAYFTNTSTGNSISASNWDFGDGNSSTVTNPTHNYTTGGNYTVCLIVTDTCDSDTSCSVVTLTCPPPTADFNFTTSLLGANFTNASTGNFIDGYAWDFGDGNTSTQNSPSHVYANAGSYTVCLVVTDSCSADTNCKVVNITCPGPSVNFGATVSTLTATFTDLTTGNFIDAWLWDFGDGNTSSQQNPMHTYAAGGTYTVCLTVSDSCDTDSLCKAVNLVCPDPSASFTDSTALFTAFFTNASSAKPNAIYSWDFGDSSPLDSNSSPSHIYATTGSYTVCLTITDSCASDTFCKTTTISCPNPTPNFSFNDSLLGVVFTDASTGISINAHLWDFGDGNTSTQASPTHTYAANGTYTVCLTVTDTCNSDSSCQSITVNCPAPTPSFSHSSSFYTATFTDVSSGVSITSYTWDFGDGNSSTQQNPVHTYASTGTYSVCLTITDTCNTDSVCNSITISCPAPNANFSFVSNFYTTTFTDATNGNFVNAYLWDFGDGNSSTQQSPVHTYASNGNYTVCLTTTDTCSTDSICKTVTINCTDPVANFSSNSSFYTATFTDNSSGNFLSTWLWDFGDGNSSTSQSPTHTYGATGNYTVCLTVSDTCTTDSICKTVAISCGLPNVAWSSNSTFYTTNFTNSSSGNFVSGYNWNFGDGNTSTLASPTHTFVSNGTYNVCLTVTDTCGMDSLCKSVTISCPDPVPGFSFGTSLMGVSFNDQSTGSFVDAWLWDFGDGNSSTQQSPSHIYATPGTYTVCMTVFDTCNSDSVCNTVVVSCPNPQAAFNHTSSLSTVAFSDASSGNFIDSYQWSFGDGNSSTLASPSHTYSANGSYLVCLTITDSCGIDSSCQTVVVTCPDPAPDFSYSTSFLNATFIDSSVYNFVQSWFWEFGDGSTSNAQKPSHQYTAAGTYQVCLTITDSCSSDSICKNVAVTCPDPQPAFTFVNNLYSVQYVNTSTGNFISGYKWYFGDGDSSAAIHPLHVYAAAGVYNACLITFDTCGSDSVCNTVTVSCPAPQVNFGAAVNFLSVSFNDSSQVNFAQSYQWDFGDGSTDSVASPTHTYTSTGTYQVCLTIADTCATDSTCKTIIVNCTGPPVAGFTDSVNWLAVSFSDTSVAKSGATLEWDFGDGNGDSILNPSHTYTIPGTYLVCLSVADSCGFDSVCRNITIVCPAPQAAFTFVDTGLVVTFTDSSTLNGAQSWLWDFGDGGTSNMQNPVHTYQNPGAYMVCLMVTDSCGSETKCESIQVDSLVGIAGILSNEIELYPNPTDGEFFVFAHGGIPGEVVISLKSLTGVELKSWNVVGLPDNPVKFDSGDVSHGIYFVEIRSPRFKRVMKIEIK